MKIRIGDKYYNKLENLKFDPSADITGTSIEVNQYSASIKTDDEIAYGDFAYLYDEKDQLWARYWITEVEEVNDGFKDIIAQSIILLLDRYTLPAEMYSQTPIATVLEEIFGTALAGMYTLDSSFAAETITGFCPEQTARERLQWVVFVIGGYINTCFTENVEILPVMNLEDNGTEIDINRTFFRPSKTYRDVVTAVKVTAYSYTQGTPASTDDYVQTGTEDAPVYYIQGQSEVTLENTNRPSTAADNIVDVSDCTLVNTGNASAIVSRLSRYYFDRLEVNFDILNEHEYRPGQKIIIHVDNKGTFASGYIDSASFTFGNKQKSSIKIAQAVSIQGKKLTAKYYADGDVKTGTILSGALIKTQELGYYQPNVKYSIENPYIFYNCYSNENMLVEMIAYVPENKFCEGIMGTEDAEVSEKEIVGLSWYPMEWYAGEAPRRFKLEIDSVTDISEEDYDIGEKDAAGAAVTARQVVIS